LEDDGIFPQLANTSVAACAEKTAYDLVGVPMVYGESLDNAFELLSLGLVADGAESVLLFY
jgi:hypothetical protein